MASALCLVVMLALSACSGDLPYHAAVEVVQRLPHDEEAFTQGLVFDDDTLYESTGLYRESTLRRVDLETGEVLDLRRLPDHLFGEGCTVWEDSVVQLTWRAGQALVYEKETLTIEKRFTYEGEGWGLTHDGEQLIMSDGTHYLRFLDPETFEEIGQVEVLDEGEPVEMLNELEWIDGQVWANVWQTSDIVRVDPESGKVLGWIDCSQLTAKEPRGVLNGIAQKGRRIFVTGKRWTNVYQVNIVASDPPDAKR